MSAPKPKDGGGSLPPPEDAHEIFLAGDDDPLIVLGADAPPVPTDGPLELLPPEPAAPREPAAPTPRAPATKPALRPSSPGHAAVPAIIDDTTEPAAKAPPAPKSPPPPRAPADYTNDPPSIATDRIREPLDFPPPAAPARRRSGPPSPWIRRAALVAAGAALAFGAWAVFSRLRPEPPVITSIVPAKAEPGQTVTIAGTALGTDASDVVIRFGDHRGAVTTAAGTSLAATVPADLANVPPGNVRVVVDVKGTGSNALFMALARYPKITAVEPEVALPGGEVSVKGQHLEGETVAVRIGGFPADVLGRDASGLRVRVPQIPVIEGKTVPVDLSLGKEAARPGSLILGHLPLLKSIAPASGDVGITVTLKGYGFAPGVARNRVTFGSLEGLVLSASENEIQAVVPALGILGSRTPLRVAVATGSARSAAFEFTAVRPSGDVFRPRFVAAPAPGGDPERHAVVGTELGPVLVLTGRADAGSTAERATRAAAALNTLMLAATSRPVLVEVKEGPLRVASDGTTIVAVTPEDAQGMARGWDGVAGAQVSAAALARYWAAVLHDYTALFGQRLRPNRALDLTPQARVLLDLYSDAERIGGSAGVSTRLVAAMAPERLDGLRRLAYAGPQESRAARGLALAGAWEGTLDEGGRPRAIRLTVRLDGNRLGGAMTSSAGKVAMGIPLHDLSYDKGMVRWKAVLGGAPILFKGNVDGATLSGTLHPAEGSAAMGRFTLRHVE